MDRWNIVSTLNYLPFEKELEIVLAKNKNLNHVGDWNSSRIIITNEKAKFYLNGEEVLSFIPWSNDWNDKISQTKNFLGTPFGSVKSGYICLQEHGSPVFFRNMKIRKL